jgi:hypothetical protein
VAVLTGLGGDPAAANPPAIGSSCANPWTETYNPRRPDMPVYNRGAQKVIRLKVTSGLATPDLNMVTYLPLLKVPGVRICHFTARLLKPAHSVICTYGHYSTSGWDITNPSGASCRILVEDLTGTSGLRVLTITAARRAS